VTTEKRIHSVGNRGEKRELVFVKPWMSGATAPGYWQGMETAGSS
jgi:hypothetical protein